MEYTWYYDERESSQSLHSASQYKHALPFHFQSDRGANYTRPFNRLLHKLVDNWDWSTHTSRLLHQLGTLRHYDLLHTCQCRVPSQTKGNWWLNWWRIFRVGQLVLTMEVVFIFLHIDFYYESIRNITLLAYAISCNKGRLCNEIWLGSSSWWSTFATAIWIRFQQDHSWAKLVGHISLHRPRLQHDDYHLYKGEEWQAWCPHLPHVQAGNHWFVDSPLQYQYSLNNDALHSVRIFPVQIQMLLPCC